MTSTTHILEDHFGCCGENRLSGSKHEHRETNQELTAVIQVRDDSALDQDASHQIAGLILKVEAEFTAFPCI